MNNISHNIDLNYADSPIRQKIHLRLLDFEQVANNPSIVKPEDKVDIVLGCDVVYNLQLAQWLPIVLNRLLKNDGVFYGIMPKNRYVKMK